MTARRTTIATAVLLGVLAVGFLWFGRQAPDAARTAAPSVPARAKVQPPPAVDLAPTGRKPGREELSGISHLADDLNAPGGTIRRDLEILNEIFGAWQTNFPRTGNPVGENAEITAALAGANVVRFAFIPPGHPAINRQGELCDRWGTPFRFHQLSGSVMEIRSAGPDRAFGTPDDASLAPASPFPIVR